MLDSEIRGFLLHNFFSHFFSISSSAYVPDQSHSHGADGAVLHGNGRQASRSLRWSCRQWSGSDRNPMMQRRRVAVRRGPVTLRGTRRCLRARTTTSPLRCLTSPLDLGTGMHQVRQNFPEFQPPSAVCTYGLNTDWLHFFLLVIFAWYFLAIVLEALIIGR